MSENLTALITGLNNKYRDLQASLMEVCGTHTNVIRRAGLHRLLPPGVSLLSGPGCPVCVTGSGYIEQVLLLARLPKMIIATFGDLLKVPGNSGTLADARATGAGIRIVYSPLDALELARENPDLQVVFLGVGFETTAPVIALAIKNAARDQIKNFTVLPALKVLNPALRALLKTPGVKLDGLIAPGHLSVITGSRSLAFLAEEYGLPTVITGFKVPELWMGLAALLQQIQQGVARLENEYPQAVTEVGNQPAQQLIKEIFRPESAEWRGLGVIEESGLGLTESYRRFDAWDRFQLSEIPSLEPPGCQCGPILLGKINPEACAHFAGSCTPEHPVGPCMVSSEGTCAAHYYYRDRGEDNVR